MYIRIAGVLLGFNEAAPGISYKPVYDARRRMVAVDESWNISGRMVLQTDASQRAMSQRIRAMREVVFRTNPDIELIEDDGVTVTELALRARDCIVGPTLTQHDLPNDGDNVYATGLSFSLAFEGRRLLNSAGANPILEFRETLEEVAGGEIRGYVGGAINAPELQIFQQRQAYQYVQSGSAVGLYGYPLVPGALWPGNQLERMRPSLASPRVLGRVDSEFEISWRYVFGSSRPLLGSPHRF